MSDRGDVREHDREEVREHLRASKDDVKRGSGGVVGRDRGEGKRFESNMLRKVGVRIGRVAENLRGSKRGPARKV